MNRILDTIKKVIQENDNIVLVSGSEVVRETGLNGIRAEHMVYEVEERYGYCGEEIVTSTFFTRQAEDFYDYYRNIILNVDDVKLTPVYKGAAALEKAGKISCIVTRMIYGLYQKAGCEKVVELYGSTEKNRCPVCNKEFPSSYIKQAHGVPKCDKCEVTLRPGFSMFGEMLDNGRLTRASNAIENAEVLLVVGLSLNSMTWRNMLRYYEGDKMILINTEEKDGDERANYRVYGNLSEIFEYLTGESVEEKS